jgi:hypothetical protein
MPLAMILSGGRWPPCTSNRFERASRPGRMGRGGMTDGSYWENVHVPLSDIRAHGGMGCCHASLRARRICAIGFRGPPALVVLHIFTPPAFPLPLGSSRRSDNWSATGNQRRNSFPRSWLVRAGNDLLMMDSLSSARTSQDRRRLGLGSPGSQSVMPPSGQARRWAPGNEGDVSYNEATEPSGLQTSTRFWQPKMIESTEGEPRP